AAGDYDPAHRAYRLTLRQTVPPTPGQPAKLPMHIPVLMGLVGADGRDLPLRLTGEAAPQGTGRVLHLRHAEEVFEFQDVPARPVPSLLRGFSAPVKLKVDLADDELAFLMAHDSDAFNRWEAGQTLATRLILGLVEGRLAEVPDAFVNAVARTLETSAADRALAAQALSLPSEDFLGQQMATIDVDGIHAARRLVRRTLAERLKDRFVEVYRTNSSNEPFSVDAEAIGRRSLKNMCLGYLMARDDSKAHGLALEQYRNAQAMTDTMAALSLLADSGSADRAGVLADFHERWKGYPLVVDKWLMVQATASRHETLDEVKALVVHPAFDIRNPNKVYALLRSFGGANPVRFHDASGAGYAFLADQLLAIDPRNPQVASRLVKCFARWRAYDSGRQDLMRRELQRIVATPGLSPDVFEVASKSLDS
ncbi:MAG TPA: DUF3458 domain-containing protein, partial [Azospirillaceae bacterium]|nr:DUF3458 domain-containing protein [Azospirillaceae bacterium]